MSLICPKNLGYAQEGRIDWVVSDQEVEPFTDPAHVRDI